MWSLRGLPVSPRDPPVLEILRRVNVGVGEKIRYARSKTPRRGLRMLVFLGEKGKENGTDSEKLRR